MAGARRASRAGRAVARAGLVVAWRAEALPVGTGPVGAGTGLSGGVGIPGWRGTGAGAGGSLGKFHGGM